MVDAREVALRAEEFAPERDPQCYYLVAVGRLAPEKGQHLLLEAVARLVHRTGTPPVRLWLVGSGPDDAALKKLSALLRLDHVVEFLGYRPNPLPWIKHADLFCCPSRYEGLPNAVVEAMLCGTPVVAADSPGGIGELLAGGRGQLARPNTVEGLAEAIAVVLHDLPRARQRAIQAQQWARSQFDADRQMRKLEALLESAHMPWIPDPV
jgi:glycosyltransferase involved in cell wall biosynthesis